MKNVPLQTLVLVTVTTLLLAGCHGPFEPEPTSHTAIMEHARAVAERVDTPEKALGEGYLPGAVCEPGMGAHWVNLALMGPDLDPDQPAAVLFLPSPDGIYDIDNATFLGIEYLVITEDLPTNTTETIPRLFDHPLDGPMAGHFPGMPWHGDLHIYLAEGMESGEDLHSHMDAIACPEGTMAPPMASVELNPVLPGGVGIDVRGWVNLTEGPFLNQLTLQVTLTGFATPGERAVHIHEHGDCGPAVDGEGNVVPGGAAGGHLNPDGHPHGEHAGDLPNLMVGEDGTGTMTVTWQQLHGPLTLAPDVHYSVLGRSIVVHEGPDDHTSQPAGDAGPRELCGVIVGA